MRAKTWGAWGALAAVVCVVACGGSGTSSTGGGTTSGGVPDPIEDTSGACIGKADRTACVGSSGKAGICAPDGDGRPVCCPFHTVNGYCVRDPCGWDDDVMGPHPDGCVCNAECRGIDLACGNEKCTATLQSPQDGECVPFHVNYYGLKCSTPDVADGVCTDNPNMAPDKQSECIAKCIKDSDCPPSNTPCQRPACAPSGVPANLCAYVPDESANGSACEIFALEDAGTGTCDNGSCH